MSESEAHDLVKNAKDLVSLPEVSLRVNELANDPNSTADDMAKEFPAEVALINIANAVAVMADFDSMSEDDEIPRINDISWELTGLSKNDLPEAIKKAQEEIKEIEAVLFPVK